MRKSEQALNKRVTGVFAILLIALVGFWIGYIGHLIRLPRTPVPTNATPLLLTQFVDVGDGDAAIASSPAGLLLLIDAGPDEDASRAVLAQLQRIQAQAPSAILLTSARLRSIGGAAYLVAHCPFNGTIVLPMPLAQFTRLGGLPARDLAAEARRRRLKMIAWQQLEASSAEQATLSDENLVATPILIAGGISSGSALAVRLDLRSASGGDSVLYAAGLTNVEEDRLIGQRARLGCDIVAATNGGHNGSLSSEFLAETGASDICVSTSAADPPDSAVLERLKAADATVRRTDLSGTVTLGLTGGLGASALIYDAHAALPSAAPGFGSDHNRKLKPS